MLPFKKRIVTDEQMRPVGVLIDYQDWEKIEQVLEASQIQENNHFDINQYSGIIKLSQDPLEFQQQVREEWS
ncbi:MAG: hypothetical protein KME64_33415 [Scytonematopsis contorta HA4267-MV1]|jgi:hypothetical protein|nr:hypothetical protein [Scytonematopsis contorta HA4267-MV1]